MRRKKGQGHDEPAEAGARLSPADVQQVEFRLAFRGYNERDVDGFLDRVTEDLSSYIEESRRLRDGAGIAPAPGAPSDEAEQIVARAREEADEILRRAGQQAAEMLTARTGTDGTRAAIAPFLNAEREFLQSLGTLVQTHAEDIRRMVFALRAKGAAEPSAPPPEAVITIASSSPASEEVVVVEQATPSVEQATRPEDAASLQPATAAEIRDRMGAAQPSSPPPAGSAVQPPIGASASTADVTRSSAPEVSGETGPGRAATEERAVTEERAPEGAEAEETDRGEPPSDEAGTYEVDQVVVETATEPVSSSKGAPPGERRERSLRELFWGED